MGTNTPHVVRASEVPRFEHTPGGHAQVFYGDEQDLGPLTIAISTTPQGGGSQEHRHPCTQLFLIVQGTGTFHIDGEEFVAAVGDLVVVPANTWHSNVSTSEEPLVHVEVLPMGRSQTEVRQ